MLLVECGPEHPAEREYAVSVLLGEFLGLEHRVVRTEPGSDVVIRLAGDDVRRLVVRDALFGSVPRLLHPGALPRPPLQRLPRGMLDGALVLGDLPVLYGDTALTTGPSSAELGIDVFAGAFAMLTRLEEAVRPERDAHGRFPLAASVAAREHLLARPVVNEYAELLWWALRRLWPGLERPTRRPRILPTHDVDWPWFARGRPAETARAVARDLVVRRDRSLARSRVRSALAVARHGRDADPCNTFAFLMGTSEDHGVRSAFYFMPAGPDARFDSGYPLDDVWLRALMREVVSRGHEIGVHPSYSTHLDERELDAQVALLRRAREEAGDASAAVGGRQHFLRFAAPGTWRAWARAGLDYDSTVGFAEAAGFRAGTCFEYPVFDLELRRPLALRERPLVAMEASLLSYRGLTPDEAAGEMRSFRDLCRRFGGDFVFLWHNNRLADESHRRAYAAVLEP